MVPGLLGFSVEQDLSIGGIEVQAPWGDELYDEMRDEVSAVLTGLVSERDDAAELLRGRTFARTLH